MNSSKDAKDSKSVKEAATKRTSIETVIVEVIGMDSEMVSEEKEEIGHVSF
jgi:hypothetical protein